MTSFEGFVSDNQDVYMTVLTNDAYVKGVKALKRSLIQVHSKHDLVILVPQSKADDLKSVLKKKSILDKHCIVCVEEDIDIDYPPNINFHQHYWSNTFFKLSVANCTQFRKIILLDSDMLIRHNIDHLFNKPSYSAVASGHCAHPTWTKLNSGLMIIEPNRKLYSRLLDSIEPAMYRCFAEGKNIGDQDVFQEAYKDWEFHNELNLPEKYNCFFSGMRILAEKSNVNMKDIAVVHFIGASKPWSQGLFSRKTLRTVFSCLMHGHFFELKIYIKYLLLATL